MIRLYDGRDKEFEMIGILEDIIYYLTDDVFDYSGCKSFEELNEKLETNNAGMDFYHIEKIEMYSVIEEDNDIPKGYDLTKGKFSSLEEAKEFAQYLFARGKEDIFVVESEDYESGNYNYIVEYRH